MEKILVLNPGSTSTKIAVYDGEKPIFTESIVHTPEQLAPFDKVMEQYAFRKNLVVSTMEKHGISASDLTAVVSRGGLLGPVNCGAYEINDDMIWQLENKPLNEHASNVGAKIALTIAREQGIPSYVYDGITVDELTDINRLTGVSDIQRKGLGHNLNTRAAAIRYAKEKGKTYQDITVIVAHLGGGITVNLHSEGRIIDIISDEEGPYSPERAGGLPVHSLIHKCFEEGQTEKKMMALVKRQGGFMSHLGTTDCIEIEKRISDGDEHAKLVYDGMCLNIAKNIGKCAPVVRGKVDAVIITGGIAYSRYVTDYITDCCSFIAPVVLYPGENEMDSLAFGCLRVLRKEETAGTYVKVENLR